MTTRARITTLTLRSLGCVVLFAASSLGAALVLRPSDVAATPPAAPGGAAASQSPAQAPATPAPSPAPQANATPAAEPTTATVTFAVTPPTAATVTWGRKLLGRIKPGRSLTIVRPRDSGPLDVMVRAPGYFAVQTRAHTFSDNRVFVKLTPLDKASELLGYRVPLDAGVETAEETAALNAIATSDAGVAPSAPPLFQVVPQTPAVPGPWIGP